MTGVPFSYAIETILKIPQPPKLKTKTHLLDKTHTMLSSQIHRIEDLVDTFFVEPNELQESDENWLRLKGGWGVDKEGEYRVKREIKLHLDLQSTRNKLRLLFQSESSDTSRISPVDIEAENGETEAGLRYLLNTTSRTRFNADAGLRISHDADPFVKFRFRHLTYQSDRTIFRPIQTVKLSGRKGIKSISTLELDQTCGYDCLLRLREKAIWRSKAPGLQFSSEILFFSPLSERSAYVIKAQAVAHNHPSLLLAEF
ncbi:MAG: hypothetical protein CSA19_01010 [Deltaproteobacteria bacterium]|nr:MAG: hypothetical protein CSA19_01010 [Deltaproteobacteria bacterium]